jgi:hypothetical protein
VDEAIVTTERRGPNGIEYDAIKLKQDDPRLASVEEVN